MILRGSNHVADTIRDWSQTDPGKHDTTGCSHYHLTLAIHISWSILTMCFGVEQLSLSLEDESFKSQYIFPNILLLIFNYEAYFLLINIILLVLWLKYFDAKKNQ